MSRITVLSVLVLSAVVPSPSAVAQSSQAHLSDQITVTADRIERPKDDVGSSVTVLTADQIELRRKTTVAELLRTVPGLEVVRGGGFGQVTSVFVRGGSSSHALVLVDGVRVNAATTGAFDFADLTADQVERIEIVRGPQSTLYGSEAVAGVISITTRRGSKERRFDVLAEGGELGSRRFSVSASGATERFDYTVGLTDQETDGVSAAALAADGLNRAVETDHHENTTATGRLGVRLGENGRLDLSVRAFDAATGNDGFDFTSFAWVDDPNRVQEREGVIASVRFEKSFGKRVRQSVTVGWNDDELRGIDPDDPFSNFTIESQRRELTAQTDVHFDCGDSGSSGVLTFGFSTEDRDGASVGFFDESVTIHSVFVQNVWSPNDRFHLTLGGRYDDHSTFGGETTWRTAASWDVALATRLHASYGTGFKAPTLNDLFFPFFSNPDLDPETSRGFDAGIEQGFGDAFTVDLTWFDTDYEDLIVVVDFTTFKPENLAKANAQGVELALGWHPGATWDVEASYTWMDTEDLTSGLPLPRRPEGRGVLELFFKPTERLRGVATVLAVRDRFDVGGVAMDDYERVDLVVHYRVSERWEPYIKVENLFDEDYQEVPGFLTPGSVAVVGLGAQF